MRYVPEVKISGCTSYIYTWEEIIIDAERTRGYSVYTIKKPNFVIGTLRITVDEVFGALIGGMNYDEIEREYGIEKEDILAVIAYSASFVRGEEIPIFS